MAKYEYEWVSAGSNNVELNKMGALGWRVVPNSLEGTYILMERPLPEPTGADLLQTYWGDREPPK